MDKNSDKNKEKGKTRTEKYLRMNEKEKDIEIQNAVIRLQNRIKQILYLMETEMKSKVTEPKKEEKEKNDEKKR